MIDALLGDPLPEDWRLYTPVLRAKTSEWDAVSRLSPAVRNRIAPIIEFVPDWKVPGATTSTRKRRAPQTPTEYVTRFLESLAKATPSDTRAFVYFGHAGAAAQWKGIDLWDAFVRDIPDVNDVIPLVDLSTAASSPSLIRLTKLRRHVAFRIATPDVGPALAGHLATTLQVLEVAPRSAHLIFDLKDQPTLLSHGAVRAAVGNAHAFASLTLLSGVFPRDLQKYRYGIDSERRVDWQTWWTEHSATSPSERLLAFGDYTTQCAHYHVPPDEARGTVSLRYTADADYLVFRGRKSNSATGFGHSQMTGHCRLLVRRPEFCGAAFSAGDADIHCWTSPTNGTGGYRQWRTASFVHHITHVVVQLQDAVGSSATLREWARAQPPVACR